MIKEK